VWETPSY